MNLKDESFFEKNFWDRAQVFVRQEAARGVTARAAAG